MRSKRKLAKQILILLRNLKGADHKLEDVEIIFRDGLVCGYKLEIKEVQKPKLKAIKGGKLTAD